MTDPAVAGPPPAGRRDPGRQPERTRLAWRRTALAMTVILALTVRLAFTRGLTGALVVGAMVLLWAAAVRLCWRRSADAGPGTHSPALPLAALATAGYAALGAVLVIRGVW